MKLSDLILMRLRIRSRVRRAAPVAGLLVALVEYLEVVFEGAHPRTHLFFLGARQKADVLADRHGDAGHDDLAVALAFEHLGQSGGQRQQGLAGAGLAEQGDEIDLRIHQQIEGEVLLAVARVMPQTLFLGCV
jgi:hypothetical protein